MFSSDEVAELRRLLEINRIQEVMSRYVRGADRGDEGLMRSTYWEDSFDNHGTFIGPGQVFIDRRVHDLKIHRPTITGMYHLTAPVNVLELNGTTAKVETYFHYVATNSERGLEILQQMAGRYLDFFEKRNAEWRILRRHVVYDWISAGANVTAWDYVGVPFPSDNVGQITNADASYRPEW